MAFEFEIKMGNNPAVAVTPANWQNVEYQWYKEPNMAYFRKRVTGDFIFTGQDYDLLMQQELSGNNCRYIIFYIYKICTSGRTLDWEGRFSTRSGFFDLDKCTFKVTPVTYDEYHCFDLVFDKEYNLLDYSIDKMDLTMHTDEVVQVLNEEIYGIDICIGTYEEIDSLGNVFNVEYSYNCSNNALASSTWYDVTHNVIPAQIPVDWTWAQVIEGAENRNGVLVWVKYTWYERLQKTIIANCDGFGNCYPLSGWTELSNDCPTSCTYWKADTTGVSGTYTWPARFMLIENILKIFLNSGGKECHFKLSSIFFNINPDVNDIFYLLTGGGVLNYVTGSPTKVDKLVMAQKSDFKLNNPDPATRAEIRPQELFDSLRLMFQVHYALDGKTLKLEHISYFESSVSLLDLSITHTSEQDNKNRYGYYTEEIPKQEVFSFMESEKSGAGDFAGLPIEYENLCATGDEATYSVSKITTNVGYIVDYPDEISNDGFVMLAIYNLNGTNYIRTDVGLISGSNRLNASLSWANLHYDYHRHNRFLPSGKINGNLEYFLSWRPNIKQDRIVFQNCCSEPQFNPSEKFNTVMGLKYLRGANGIVDSAKYRLATESIDVTFKYRY